MSVLILGGNRFMGRHLADQLAAAGRTPVLFNRGNLAAPAGIEVVNGDRSAPDGLAALRGRRFEAIVDLSAYKSDWVARAIAILGDATEHYLFVSSGAVYEPLQSLPWSEESPIGPDPAWGAYGREKARAERQLADFAAAGLRVTVIRPPFVLGPENYADRESFIFSRLVAGRPILLAGGGRAVNQYAHAADVAAAIVALLARRPASSFAAYNVGMPAAISNRGLVELCAEISGKTAKVIDVDEAALGVKAPEIDLTDVIFPFPDSHYFLDCSKLARDTGFSPRFSLRQTLEQFYAGWRKGQGPALQPKPYKRETQALEALGERAA